MSNSTSVKSNQPEQQDGMVDALLDFRFRCFGEWGDEPTLRELIRAHYTSEPDEGVEIYRSALEQFFAAHSGLPLASSSFPEEPQATEGPRSLSSMKDKSSCLSPKAHHETQSSLSSEVMDLVERLASATKEDDTVSLCWEAATRLKTLEGEREEPREDADLLQKANNWQARRITELTAQAATLHSRVEELTRAVEPFAKAAERTHDAEEDTRLLDLFTVGSELTVGHLRAARSALTSQNNGEGDNG